MEGSRCWRMSKNVTGPPESVGVLMWHEPTRALAGSAAGAAFQAVSSTFHPKAVPAAFGGAFLLPVQRPQTAAVGGEELCLGLDLSMNPNLYKASQPEPKCFFIIALNFN